MITVGIITEVNSTIIRPASIDASSYVHHTYRVRIPTFVGDETETNNADLPIAVAATLPHAEGTVFRVGDVVYVGIVDEDLDNLVILGMAPHIETTDASLKDLRGARETESQIALKDVQSIESDLQGNVSLPYNTKLHINLGQNTDKYITGARTIVGSEFATLSGMDSPIVERFRRLDNSINTFSTRFNLQAKFSGSFIGVDPNLDSDTWVRSSGFTEVGKIYYFICTKVGSIDVWTVTVHSVDYNFTKETLESQCGVAYTSCSNKARFQVEVTDSPLGIYYGGTSARTEKEALENLGAFSDVVIHMDSFKELEAKNKLESNTVYYIYDNTEEEEEE